MDDYESNVKHLQDWIRDTKKLAAAPPAVEQAVVPLEKHQLQQVRLHLNQLKSAYSVKQIRGVFGNNLGIIFHISP